MVFCFQSAKEVSIQEKLQAGNWNIKNARDKTSSTEKALTTIKHIITICCKEMNAVFAQPVKA